jgi:hypothetical protein
MSIVALAAMKAELGIIDSVDDTMIQSKIDAAEAHLEQLLGYTFAEEFPDTVDVNFPDTVPADLLAAIKQLAAHLYENREATVVGVSASELPFGVWDVVRERRNYSF